MRRKSLVSTQKDQLVRPSCIHKSLKKKDQVLSLPFLTRFNMLVIILLILMVLWLNKFKTIGSSDEDNLIMNRALNLQKEWLQEETCWPRKRIIIFSSWRSGSSFVGGLFESDPGIKKL